MLCPTNRAQCSNPEVSWLDGRGVWIVYLLFFTALHVIIVSLPIVSVPLAWTITNILHNLAQLYFLHWICEGSDDKSSRFTQWEQINDGKQFTSSRKFLTAVPIIVFLMTCMYTKNNPNHFVINFISLLIVLLPKLPQFHGVRLFGINKY